MRTRVAWALLGALALAGCFDSGEARLAEDRPSSVPRRRGAVIVDGCTLDAAQRATLQTPGARRVLQEIVLLCLAVDENGRASPTDMDAREALFREIGALRALGYRVLLGAGLGTSRDSLYGAERAGATLAAKAARDLATTELGVFAAAADGIDLHLAPLPSASRDDLTAYVSGLSKAIGRERLELFLPPSQTSPSDLPGGEAFALQLLAPLVSRLRVMTLDYSCCPGPGPTVEPLWAQDVMTFTRREAGGVPLDFAFPLYGTDFGPNGQRSVTWLEATGLSQAGSVTVRRTANGAPTFGYDGSDGAHVVHFDDATSTSLFLSALDHHALPADVGVVFYGLGAEEPGLFGELSRRTP